MILGSFRDGHPRVVLTVIGTDRPLPIEFIVDTGFAGELTLTAALANQLGLRFKELVDWELADGTVIPCRTLNAVVELEEEERTTEVLALGNRCLVGTDFLKGY